MQSGNPFISWRLRIPSSSRSPFPFRQSTRNLLIALVYRYEDEISRLTRELEARGGAHASHPQNVPSQPPPPSIGHGPRDLFGGIMAGQGGQGGPGLAPPPQEAQQQQQAQQQPQHPPQIPPPQASLPPQQQQQPPLSQPPTQSQPPAGYPQGSYINGYGGQPPQPTASPGAKSQQIRPPRAVPGPGTPQQQPQGPYPDPRGSPQVARPSPIPPAGTSITNNLADLDPERLPPHQKKEGSDWYAVYNPRVPRVLDVDLVHTLDHHSVVCCVRFSADGKYIATGCNRSAQIYDVETGQKVTTLQDDSVDRDGDLYIRSVCFSPDGRFLATGAEDKQIRVSYKHLHFAHASISLTV